MNWKQLNRLLIAVIVMVIAAVLFHRWDRGRQQRATEGVGQKVFADFPLNEVSAFSLTDGKSIAELAKTDGKWRVVSKYGFPADFEKVSRFLISVSDLKMLQSVAVGPAQYGRLKLVAPKEGDEPAGDGETGTQILFEGDSKTIASLRLGKEHMRKNEGYDHGWPDGRYVLVRRDGEDTVGLVSEVFSSASADAKEWLNKELAKIKDVQTATLADGEGLRWTLQRSADDKLEPADLAEGEEVETYKLSSVGSAFSYARFADIADPEIAPEDSGLDTPTVYTAVAKNGVTYTLNIGQKAESGEYYVGIRADYTGPTEREPAEDETDEQKAEKDREFKEKVKEARDEVRDITERLTPWTFLIASYTVENVLKERADFIKKPEPATEEGTAQPEGATPGEMGIIDGPADDAAAPVVPAAKPAE